MDNLTIDECYQILDLDKSASLQDIEKAYYKLVGEALKSGRKYKIESIKSAYSQLIDHHTIQKEVQLDEEKKSYELALTKTINYHLRGTSFRVKVNSFIDYLEIIIKGSKINQKKTVLNLIYQCLKSDLTTQQNLIQVKALKADNNYLWQEEISLASDSQNQLNPNTEILLAQAETVTNTYFLPITFIIAFAISFAEVLTWFIGMWVHEFGHATIAWLSGYRAMITFGATITSLQRSNFVYFGILFLLGLTLYTGWKEKKKSTVIVAIILIVIQFILTWQTSYSNYITLMAFGGIGGEFYLSTLLIISFYWRLPEKFYWEFWRFGAAVIGAITFFSSFRKWHSIKVGSAAIPWGTLWGGRGDSGGDLNILNNQAGWSTNQIVGTYVHLGNLCLLVIIAFYVYHLFLSHPELPIKIKQLFR